MAEAPLRSPPERRAFLLRSATYASVAVALVLVMAKLWAWRQTDSVSILSSLADSVLDVMASLITFWAIRFSLEPADREHRFGHGKGEGLAALFQAVIVSASAAFVAREAILRLMAPARIGEPAAGAGVIVFAVILTFALVSWQRHVSRQTGSVAIAADALHYKTDLLTNASVLVAIGISAFTDVLWLDPVVGLGIALYLLRGAWQIGTKSLDILLDREIPDEDRNRIRDIALRHQRVLGFHDLRTRHSGGGYIVQFHLELAPSTSLVDTHLILDEVEDWIRAAYPGCEIIIHPDPLGFAERRDHFGEAGPS